MPDEALIPAMSDLPPLPQLMSLPALDIPLSPKMDPFMEEPDMPEYTRQPECRVPVRPPSYRPPSRGHFIPGMWRNPSSELSRRLNRYHQHMSMRLPGPGLEAGAIFGGRSQPGTQDEYALLLTELRSGDAGRMQHSVVTLSTKLAMAQENSVSSHSLQLFVEPLISCLQAPLPGEVISMEERDGVVPAMTCLTHLIDIEPQLARPITNGKGVVALCQKVGACESIEIVESVINTLEKITAEVPDAVLESKALECLARVIGFFEVAKQVGAGHKCRKRFSRS